MRVVSLVLIAICSLVGANTYAQDPQDGGTKVSQEDFDPVEKAMQAYEKGPSEQTAMAVRNSVFELKSLDGVKLPREAVSMNPQELAKHLTMTKVADVYHIWFNKPGEAGRMTKTAIPLAQVGDAIKAGELIHGSGNVIAVPPGGVPPLINISR